MTALQREMPFAGKAEMSGLGHKPPLVRDWFGTSNPVSGDLMHRRFRIGLTIFRRVA
jgi:hypothetical protein